MIYQTGGLESLKEEVLEDEEDQEPFSVRLIGSQGNILIESVPQDWSGFNILELDNIDKKSNKKWTYLSGTNEDSEFEFTSLLVDDGASLEVGQSIEERENLLRSLRKVYALFIIPIVLLCYLGGIFLADQSLNPIRQLINTLNSIIKSGRVDARVPTSKTNDLHKELTLLFNTMLERIEVLIDGMRNALDNVAHDLRTPIARFRGTAEMALQEEDNINSLREALSDCIEESDRIAQILNTLLDISEAESGAMKLEKEKTNISQIVNEVLDLYSLLAEEKKISIKNELPGELYVAIDRKKFRQVLANLIDNAIKYTPSGGKVDVECRNERRQTVISLRDTGIGIPKEEIPKIWERLYRGDKSRSQKGHGLGLSLVKAVVQAHGGYIDVSSVPGVGSFFSIYLPSI